MAKDFLNYEAHAAAAKAKIYHMWGYLSQLWGMPSKRPARIFTRIMGKVQIDKDGCWIWTGAHSGDGRGGRYPRMSLDGATVAVHRVMYTLFHGFIPPRKQIDHTCKKRACCNPEHLELVTHLENQRRRDAKETD